MSTRRLRVPARVLAHVKASPEWTAWKDGRGCLATDRHLFHQLASTEARADGSVHLDADSALVETLHQWALRLTYQQDDDEAARRANVRSGRSLIRQINPREFN